ncbi:hypothetical protein ScPMuIL_011884, partial [Solemya velum]
TSKFGQPRNPTFSGPFNDKPKLGDKTKFNSKTDHRAGVGSPSGPVCNYCKKVGHVMSECYSLQRKEQRRKHDITNLKPVKILRDTGASHSLILDGVVPLSEETSSGSSVLLQGVELGFVNVPLHCVYLKSDLVTGPVTIGVRPELPIEGVSLILGNDLAGEKVR